MPDQLIRHIRLFLSSPGDVTVERKIVIELVDQLHYDPSFRGKVWIEVIAWDKPGSGTPMLATMTPQDAINKGLPKPSDCDLVIVIIWSRMGTPLPEEYIKPAGHRFKDPGGLSDQRYLSGTEWEFIDSFDKAITTGLPQLVVYRRTESVTLDPSNPDFLKQYHQWQRVETFFSTFANPDGSIKQGYNTYKQPEEFRREFEVHLRSLLTKFVSDNSVPLTSQQKTEKPLWQGSPFPGLRAFTDTDAPIFFGRGTETDHLIERLKSVRFVAVIGASGSGKSSLVWAGLIPKLQANGIPGSKDWIWFRFTPGGLGNNPFIALAAHLEPYMKGQAARDIAKTLENSPEKINQIVETLLEDKADWVELLIFIDQFEELLTLVAIEYREPFSRLLAAAIQSSRIRIIATLRADFYHQLIPISTALTTLLQQGSYPLGAPDTVSLYDMITRPAERGGVMFEDNLARLIVNDTGNEPGTLALMAYLLDELYESRTKEGLLTLGAYQKLGGVQGAIGERAENIFAELDSASQAAFSRVFWGLVEVDERGTATRRRAMIQDVAFSAPAKNLIDTLTKYRLLVQDEQNKEPIVEVAHEALLTSWDRLAEWIESVRDDLRLYRQVQIAAEEWNDHQQQKAFLWVQERLQPVYEMIERLSIDIPPRVKAFIRPEAERLLEELQHEAISHSRRSAIGERLAQIGDPRPGLGLTNEGIPEILWCDIQAGTVAIGGAFEINHIEAFQIAKYPITFAQYQAFVEADDGYPNDEWWIDLNRENPGEQSHTISNHPADNVSWYDAIAFCRWLSQKLNATIRLPYEGEWQLAACGGQAAYLYPWGKEIDESRANLGSSKLSRTVAVGLYPRGVSLMGVEDMAGNIWEWCINPYHNPTEVNLTKASRRVIRGGSWQSSHAKAQVDYRFHNLPYNRNDGLGFRVVRATES